MWLSCEVLNSNTKLDLKILQSIKLQQVRRTNKKHVKYRKKRSIYLTAFL